MLPLYDTVANINAAFTAQISRFDSLFETINTRLSRLDAAVDEMRTSLESREQAPLASSRSIRTDYSLMISFQESAPWNGIIAYLTRKYRNVHTNNIVTVSSKSISTNLRFHSQHAVDLASGACFWSSLAPSQWVCRDFGELRAIRSDYAVRT
jgi:subtilase family serine protease